MFRSLLLASLFVASCAQPSTEPAGADPVDARLAVPEAASDPTDAAASEVAPPSSESMVAPPVAPPATPAVPSARPSVAGTDVHAVADEALRLIAARDARALSAMVHPKWGVRFTPYTHVDTTADVVLTRAQLESAMTDPTVRTWGSYDGRGDPIRATAAGYWSEFVWNKDYAKSKPLFDARRGGGLAGDNAATVYPGAHVVEWYVPARPDWLDWGALRLVFATDATRWWLVGVIHDQWVI